MAELFVRNSLNSYKSVKFNTSLKEYVLKGEDGDSKWVLVVGTTYPDANGNPIPPVFIHKVTEANVSDEISKAIESMCALIDWTVLEEDKDPPYVSSFSPEGINVPIKSKVVINIKENLPASGVDLSEVSVIFNNGEVDFDITSELEITGDPYDYTLTWLPPNLAW